MLRNFKIYRSASKKKYASGILQARDLINTNKYLNTFVKKGNTYANTKNFWFDQTCA